MPRGWPQLASPCLSFLSTEIKALTLCLTSSVVVSLVGAKPSTDSLYYRRIPPFHPVSLPVGVELRDEVLEAMALTLVIMAEIHDETVSGALEPGTQSRVPHPALSTVTP